jgi:hypothetical protein
LHAALEVKHKKSYSGHPVQGRNWNRDFFPSAKFVPILCIATSVTWWWYWRSVWAEIMNPEFPKLVYWLLHYSYGSLEARINHFDQNTFF